MLIDTRIRFFPQPTKIRPNLKPHSAELTVYYLTKVDIKDVIETIGECLEPNFGIYVVRDTFGSIFQNLVDNLLIIIPLLNAWFFTKSPNPDGDYLDEEGYFDLKMIYPNNWAYINKTNIITNEDDLAELQDECTNEMFAKRLVRQHDLSKKIGQDSKLQFHKVVSVQIFLKKKPYQY